MGPWARALRAQFGDADGDVPDLRIEPGLVTGGGATLSAPVIPPGIWAEVDVSSPALAQTLEHTWEEPLVPAKITRVGSRAAVDALGTAFAAAVDADPALLLRWRGRGSVQRATDDAWSGAELPPLPPSARRPPDSVPKRFGASGVVVHGEDLVEPLVRLYGSLEH